MTQWRETHRALFAFGALSLGASVLPWLAYSQGIESAHRDVYHMIASAQGGLLAFGAGFLIAGSPRVAAEAAVSRLATGFFLLTAAGTVAAAWLRWTDPPEFMLALSEVFWLSGALGLGAVAFRRRRREARADRSLSYSWVVLALIFGIAGAGLVSTYSTLIVVRGWEVVWLVKSGRGLLLQGTAIAALIAAAPMLRKRFYLSAGTADGAEGPGRAGNLAAAVLFAASVAVEIWFSVPLGMALRACAAAALLAGAAGLRRVPTRASWLARLTWGAVWLLPLGYAAAAAAPEHRQSGLHMIFIGTFSLGSLAAALDLALDGRETARRRIDRALPVSVLGGLFAAALLFRAPFESATHGADTLLAASSAAFLLGLLFWGGLMAWSSREHPRSEG